MSERKMAAKLKAMKLKQAKEKEQMDAKVKQLNDEMTKGTKNLKVIESGLKNNDMNFSEDITSNIEKKVPTKTVTPSSSSVAIATSSVITIQDSAFPTPSGPRVSTWAYTGEQVNYYQIIRIFSIFDSNSLPEQGSVPPIVKTYTMYETIRLLGRGAFGEVNLVKCIEDSKLYASKTIYCEKEDYLSASLKEVSFLRSNRHPCIIDVHDVFIVHTPRVLHILMPYCETGSVSKLIESTKKPSGSMIPETVVIKILLQLLLGLQFLHENKVLHRDLKTDNIMLTEGGDMIKIIDFGLAVQLTDQKSYCQSEAGTPYYMSPELIQNERYAYPADCWALGKLLMNYI